MAIVADRSTGTVATDKPYTSFNRKNAGEPNGALIPQYCGEIVLDTTNNALWKAMDIDNGSWIALTAF